MLAFANVTELVKRLLLEASSFKRADWTLVRKQFLNYTPMLILQLGESFEFVTVNAANQKDMLMSFWVARLSSEGSDWQPY